MQHNYISLLCGMKMDDIAQLVLVPPHYIEISDREFETNTCEYERFEFKCFYALSHMVREDTYHLIRAKCAVSGHLESI